MPLCKMEGSYKCSFLNTQSLHCHIRDVQASHTLKDSDVIMLCETCLSPHDLNINYKMDTFADIIHHYERTGNEL